MKLALFTAASLLGAAIPCAAQTINLKCDGTNGNGQPLSILLSIDQSAKFVRWQEPIQILEFRDGDNSRAVKQSKWSITEGAGRQFVQISDDTIRFGITTRRTDESYDIRINRNTGMLTTTQGVQWPCSVLAPQRF